MDLVFLSRYGSLATYYTGIHCRAIVVGGILEERILGEDPECCSEEPRVWGVGHIVVWEMWCVGILWGEGHIVVWDRCGGDGAEV
jgi:hypothetical protein